MAQFTIYRSSDGSAPVLDGQAGSLIALFKACLVDGYGAKAAPSPAWTQPVATSGNIGSFQQGAGSGFGFVLNDNGPNGTSTYKEAWATGWEVVSGVGSPVGSGTNQFPTPAQLLTSGHVVIRKSAAASAVTRDWILVADSRTMYFFALTADVASVYYGFSFGDCYSIKSTADVGNCYIMGRNAENSTSSANEAMDTLSVISGVNVGHYMARAYGGASGSLNFGKHGEYPKGASGSMVGNVAYPNPTDGETYITPVWCHESSVLRGRMRGFYEMLHPIANFTDGQTITASSGYYSGKSFLLVKTSPNSGIYVIETSNTLETN